MRAGQTIQDGSVLWKVIDSRAVATESDDGLMSASDKAKLNGIERNANKYNLPIANDRILGGVKIGDNIRIDINGTISLDKNSIINALGYTPSTTSVVNYDVDGLMTTADKKKLDGIEARANRYVLPNASIFTLGGVRIGENITVDTGTISIKKANGTTFGVVKVGNNISVDDGTISVKDSDVTNALGYVPPNQDTVTQSKNGLMSKEDKKKLDGIEEHANNYSLPAATSNTLGGVKIGSNISVSNGTVSVPYGNTSTAGVVKVGSNITSGSNGLISVPIGSTSVLGVVKTGNNITNSSGTISVPYGNTSTAGVVKVGSNLTSGVNGLISVPVGSTSVLGVVKIGSNISVSNGVISIPNASNSVYGVVKTGSNISISNGVISISKDNVTSALGYTPATQDTVTQNRNGLMIAGDKAKLDNIQSNANNYTLPQATNSVLGGVKIGNNISISNGAISISKDNVTSALGYTPPGTSVATTTTNGLMSASDKAKLDGIASGAGNYTLPTASSSVLGGVKIGNNISISNGAISISKDNVTSALGYTPPGTSVATTTSNGLMSASDKTKLDGIAVNANNYTLPTASSSTLGGVKIGSNISVNNGVISISKDNITNALGYVPPSVSGGGTSSYTLPTASSSTLGGVKIGSNISVNNGVISISKDNITNALGYVPPSVSGGGTSSYTLPTASSSTLGGVKIGSNISISNGVISVPAASSSVLGGVKIGSNITNSSGTISISKDNVTSALGYTPPGTSVATTTTNGLMSASDKAKLDGIASGAGNYTLPTASSSVLGGVKIGSNITIGSGVIGVPEVTTVTAGVMTALDKKKLDALYQVANVIVKAPIQTKTLTFNNKAQSPTWDSTSNLTKIAGLDSAQLAGQYDITWEANSGYVFSDGSKTAVTTWTIEKADPTITTDPSGTFELNPNKTISLTIKGSFDGTIKSIRSDNTSVFKVSTSNYTNKTATIEYVGKGTAHLVVEVNAGTSYNAGSQSFTVNCTQLTGSIDSVSAVSLNINSSSTTRSISYTSDATYVTAKSNNESIVTVSTSGKIATFNFKKAGNTTVTVTVPETSKYKSMTTNVSITCSRVNPTFGNIIDISNNTTVSSVTLTKSKSETVEVTGSYTTPIRVNLENNNGNVTYSISNQNPQRVTFTYNKATTTTVKATFSCLAGDIYNGGNSTRYLYITCNRSQRYMVVNPEEYKENLPMILNKDTQTKTVEVFIDGLSDGTLSYSIADSDVATVSLTNKNTTTNIATYNITYKTAGKTSITFSMTQGAHYLSNEIKMWVESKRKDATLIFEPDNYIRPDPFTNKTVTQYFHGDYDGDVQVSLPNNVTFTANYKGKDYRNWDYFTVEHQYLRNTVIADVTVNISAGKFYNAISGKIGVAMSIFELYNLSTWSQVKTIVQAGWADDWWDVGDTFPVILNGSMGRLRFSNFECKAFIIGFDHDSAFELNNINGGSTVTFQFAKLNDGTAVTFDIFDDSHLPYNSGGTLNWSNSNLRSMCGSLYNACPSDLKNAIKPVRKKYTHVINYMDDWNRQYSKTETATSNSEQIFCLSESEYTGSSKYPYYNSNSIAGKLQDGTTPSNRVCHITRDCATTYNPTSGYTTPNKYSHVKFILGQWQNGSLVSHPTCAPAFVIA